jgi:hypothetical protein
MIPPRLELIPLGQAALCIDCRQIGRSVGCCCAGCGSENLVDLSSLLTEQGHDLYELERSAWLSRLANEEIC